MRIMMILCRRLRYGRRIHLGRRDPRLEVPAQQGTSLLEVLLGALLVAVLGLLIFTSFAIGLRAAALAGGMDTALGAAEEALTRIPPPPCGAFPAGGPDANSLPVLPKRYQRDIVTRMLPGARQWELSVQVSWRHERGQHSVRLMTYRYISLACEFVGE